LNYKLELIAIPVTDVDRAKVFYVDQIGFVADHDHTVNADLRFVQPTPSGSTCSINIGIGITMPYRDAARRHRHRKTERNSPYEVSMSATCIHSRGARSSTSPIPTATPGRFKKSRGGAEAMGRMGEHG
jgi:catechol 2,3-dioxygenase-like lactoylglutathione lyase family enzyme